MVPAAKALVAAAIGHPLGLHDLRGGHLGRAQEPDLARMHEVGEGAEGLVDVGVRIGDADLVEIDPVGLEPAQRTLDTFDDPPPRGSSVVGIRVERRAELDGEHHTVAPPAGQRLADDLLRLAAGVAVGGVDEVDPRVQRPVDDPHRVVVIGVAEGPKHHRAQAHLADRDSGATEGSIVHEEVSVLLRAVRAARHIDGRASSVTQRELLCH